MEEADFKRLLDVNAAETRAYFDVVAAQLTQDLRQEIVASADGLRQELRQEIAASANALQQGLRQEIAASAQGLRQEMAASAQGLRQEMAYMRDDFGALADNLASKIELVAEGVAIVNEKLDRETADIRTEMRQGFSDTHDLIRFTRDLDRRAR